MGQAHGRRRCGVRIAGDASRTRDRYGVTRGGRHRRRYSDGWGVAGGGLENGFGGRRRMVQAARAVSGAGWRIRADVERVNGITGALRGAARASGADEYLIAWIV